MPIERYLNSGAGAASGGSSVTVSETSPSNPKVGDLWYNSATGQTLVYYDNSWVESNNSVLGPTGPSGPIGPTGANGKFTVTASTPPASPSEGDVWYNSDTGRMFVYYDSYWVESSTAVAGPTGPTGPFPPVTFSTLGPTGGTDGDVWFRYDA